MTVIVLVGKGAPDAADWLANKELALAELDFTKPACGANSAPMQENTSIQLPATKHEKSNHFFMHKDSSAEMQ